MEIANHVPHMRIKWTQNNSMTPHEVGKALRDGKPSIVLSTANTAKHFPELIHAPARRGKIIAAELVKFLKAHLA